MNRGTVDPGVGGPDPQVRERFARYRVKRDRALRNELVELHRPFAEQVARRYAGRGEPFDDLVQVALLGLLKAVERYDPDLGFPFEGFAAVTMHGELKLHFRDRIWRLSVPRRAKERSLGVPGAVDALTQRHGRSPTLAEIAEALGWTQDDVLEAIEIREAQRPVNADIGSSVLHAGALSHHVSALDPGFDAFDERDLVCDLLRTIPPRERTVCELRFVGGLRQRDIAEQLGISQMQVSRLLTRSIERMRVRALRSSA